MGEASQQQPGALPGGVLLSLLFYEYGLDTEKIWRHPGNVIVKPIWR